MRIIFLDFDGVLNSHEFIARVPPNGGVVGLDPIACERLVDLVERTEARVVVSSTWRHNRDRRQLSDLLGFNVLGRTPRWLHKTPGGIYAAESRGQEIQAWLDAADDYGREVESFVIIDNRTYGAYTVW